MKSEVESGITYLHEGETTPTLENRLEDFEMLGSLMDLEEKSSLLALLHGRPRVGEMGVFFWLFPPKILIKGNLVLSLQSFF